MDEKVYNLTPQQAGAVIGIKSTTINGIAVEGKIPFKWVEMKGAIGKMRMYNMEDCLVLKSIRDEKKQRIMMEKANAAERARKRKEQGFFCNSSQNGRSGGRAIWVREPFAGYILAMSKARGISLSDAIELVLSSVIAKGTFQSN